MRFLTVVFWLALSLSALAQDHTVLTLGFGRTPGTEVHIINDTEDAALQLAAGNKNLRGFLEKGGDWKAFYSIGYGDAPILIRVCQSVTRNNAYTIIAPPIWAMRTEIVGGAALDVQYLTKNPTEADLRKHVAALEKALEGRLGRKEMIAELHDWFSVVKKNGLEHYGGDNCGNPRTLAIRVRVQDFYYERLAVILVVRGNREKGYRIDGPRNAWY